MKNIKSRISVQYKSILMLADLGVLFLLLSTIYRWQFVSLPPGFWFSPALWLMGFVTLSALYIFGTYDVDKGVGSLRLAGRVVLSVALAVFAMLFLHFFFAKMRIGLFSRTTFLGGFFFYSLFAVTIRIIISEYHSRRAKRLKWLFIVSSQQFSRLAADIQQHRFSGHVSFLVEEESAQKDSRVIGTWKDLSKNLDLDWAGVVVAIGPAEPKAVESIHSLLMEARFAGHLVIDLGLFYEKIWKKVPVYYLTQSWFVSAEGFGFLNSNVSAKIKRLTDLFFATLLLIIFSPFILLTAIAVKLESHGPFLYKQTRTGQFGRSFTIYKFRSMTVDAEKNGAVWASKNDNRITRVGKFIRLSRLDELPQLLNVFRGDMSFVGPRPERPEFNSMLDHQIPFYNLRHILPPGITGWAQVLYPYGASVEDSAQKLQYDLYYIRHYSVFLDVKIILKTVSVVFLGRGR